MGASSINITAPASARDLQPCSCPSYIETHILDQAVPFIIFLSRYSALQDRLSAAAILDSRLLAWRRRLKSQQSLLQILQRQLHTCEHRLGSLRRQSSRFRNATGFFAFLRSLQGNHEDILQARESECKVVKDKIFEVEAAIGMSQGEIKSILDAVKPDNYIIPILAFSLRPHGIYRSSKPAKL